jgi:ankyrin repeat protein
VQALEALDNCAIPRNLDAGLANGMTPMDLAVKAGKHASATWLAQRGATLDILQAWDLGWKAHARRLLRESPELANRRTGGWQITPLHEAASRNDVALAALLLTANPDLGIADTQFQSTPLGWARHFERTEIVALLERHEKGKRVRGVR